MVGLHAAFTCSDETIAAAADLAARRGVGVHVHVAEGRNDAGAADRLRQHTTDDWLLIHGVHLADDHGLRGTLVHNPRSNMNNGVGYARPARFADNPVALGTDGIGADMLDEFRLAYAKLRERRRDRLTRSSVAMARNRMGPFPAARNDSVVWSYEPVDPWRLAFTTGVRPLEVSARRRDGLARRCAHPRRRRRDPDPCRRAGAPAVQQAGGGVIMALSEIERSTR